MRKNVGTQSKNPKNPQKPSIFLCIHRFRLFGQDLPDSRQFGCSFVGYVPNSALARMKTQLNSHLESGIAWNGAVVGHWKRHVENEEMLQYQSKGNRWLITSLKASA